VGGGNFILGLQPVGDDFTPGDIVLRLQNNTGVAITALNISYDLWYRNDANRANSLNFAYSPDGATYTAVPALDFTTPQAADAGGWQPMARAATLAGLSLAPGSSFYLRWRGDDAGGSGARDEYGLDQIQVAVVTGDDPPAVTGTTPADGATGVAVDANLELNFSEAVNTGGDWFQLACAASGLRLVADTIVTGGPSLWTIDPNADFAPAETCTLTVFAAQISDLDGAPDHPAADYSFSFTIAAAAGGWVINEIHADPHAANGDANHDGVVQTGQDEFVELANNTGAAVDISGWTLSDASGVRHTFPAGTVVPHLCAALVFGGGTPAGAFGGAIVQTAGTLGLNNDGDTVTLSDGSANLAVYTYGGEGGDNQALTRDPDLTGPEPLVRHSTAAGSGGALFSPGTRLDGTPFAGCSPPDLPPQVAATDPVTGAVNVPVTGTVTITFSEAVSVTAAAFALACPAGAPLGFSLSPAPPGNVAGFTLTPAANLPAAVPCTVTVLAGEVTDQDGLPDPMPADYILTFTTGQPPPPPALLLIGEFLYDGLTPSTEGDEFVEVCNPNPYQVNPAGYKVGDEEARGGGEGMYVFPVEAAALAAGACVRVAKNAAQFQARFGDWPDYELVTSGSGYLDEPSVRNLDKYSSWSGGSWSLANTGDELLLLGPGDEILDSVAYRNGDYAILGLEPDASAPEPYSLQRVWPTDTNSMPHDFVRAGPNPGWRTEPPAPPAAPPPPAALPNGMAAYWGGLHAHTTYSDGAGPPFYALAVARANGLHFYGLTDHDAWLTTSEWERTLTQVNEATVPGQFVALRGLEWTPDSPGHLNIFNSATLLNHTDPQFDTLPEVYAWLAANPSALAQFNHPDPTYGGTFNDFAYDAGAASQMVLQEIGNHAQSYRTYEASFVQSNIAGWRVAPANNGDTHTANWGLDTIGRTGVVAPALTQADLLAALRARRVFSTEDANLALALRSNDLWMGSVLAATGSISLTVDFVDPDPEPLTLYVYDANLLLTSAAFPTSSGQWSTSVQAQPGHFFWVKAIQADGNTAYSAPLWIEGRLEPEPLVINEILPAPADWDWDGNGTPDHTDEWIELFNPLDRAVGLGGWRLVDASGFSYTVPLGVNILPRSYATFYYAQTNLSLNNSAESLWLIHPNGTGVDFFSYDHSPGYDECWCRLPDGGSRWSEDCGPSPHAANWEKAPAGPLTVSIYDAKRLTLDAWVRVKGQVTAPPGVLGSRTMYIQDETSGIMIYLPKDHGLAFNLWDKVEVVGNLRLYYEEFEIAVEERADVKGREPAPGPVHPLPIATTSMLEPYEGMLVLLQGQAVRFKGRTTFWVDDGTDPAKVVIKSTTGIRKPFIEPGTPITAIGIVSQYSGAIPAREDYRLLPRYPSDLLLPEQTAVPAAWPAVLPETGN
ncbi:MAG: lamin tail domain-containing protein, partial [Chloroflexota bacterium]